MIIINYDSYSLCIKVALLDYEDYGPICLRTNKSHKMYAVSVHLLAAPINPYS